MMHKAIKLMFVTVTAVLVFGCNAPPEREQISAEQLMSSTAIVAAPVLNRYFMPEGRAHEAKQSFSGTIRIPEHLMRTMPETIQPAEIIGKKTQLFPGVGLRFVSHGEYLLPVERGILNSPDGQSYWQIQVSPGRVWSERGDNGMSRASFPFFLTNLFENETYNGVATFLYDDKKVSGLRYQIVQQLSPFLVQTHFVAWGQPKIEYQPTQIPSERLFADFDQELADQMPWHDWSELESKYGADVFSDFNSGIDPSLTVASGLIIEGIVYVQSMATPYGDYPYPREMRHGVWSATKSLAGFVTLSHLAQKYGDEILDYKIKDYLNVTAVHAGWEDVRFRHAMSMATGIGTGSENIDPNNINDGYVESDLEAYMEWYHAPTVQEKLDHLFKVPNHPWGPGRFARYRDRDIFTLAAALDSLVRRKEGGNTDLWKLMTDEVYGPIGIHHMPQSTTIETDRPGVPLLAWGLYVTIDDVAKIAGLLQNGGTHDGKQLLSKAVLAEAFYETDVRGLPTGDSNEFGENSYHLSFWHSNYTTASGKTYTIPTMSGYGGNIVKLMPNGIIGFRMGNGGDKPVEQMVVIADKIRSFDDFDRRRVDRQD